jgi:hypothetical protein
MLISNKKDVMKRSQPKHFSDHFKIDKAKLKELGVFDPILNLYTNYLLILSYSKKAQTKLSEIQLKLLMNFL